ncbi:MAG: YeeE/YedE thiosulfate transporter family protein [Burkholderiaceae bacterium]
MQTEFTPWMSLGGGALIGLSAVMLMAANGRIAGISGIVSRLLPPAIVKTDIGPGVAFVVGLLLSVGLYWLAMGTLPAHAVSTNYGLLAGAGLLVGFGSVLGNGCTSGHGVCGISRLSMRSVMATVTFMGTGFISVYVLRHVLGG